jgi:heptosyltransferase III
MCFPAMEDLRAGTDYLEVWVPSAVVPLVQFADRVRAIASTGLDSMGIACRQPAASLIEALRSFDSIVCWYGTNREEFVAQCGSLGLAIEFRAALPALGSGDQHAVDFFLGQALTDRYPRLKIAGQKTGVAGTFDFVAVHPFSGSRHKDWPLDRFRQLAERLPLPVCYCIGREQTLTGAVEYADLYDLAAWIRNARLYIGNDSGITHLAAAAGVPTVAIFGYSNPRVWAPRGKHVRIVAGQSLLDVEADAVLRTACDLLDGSSGH